MSEPQVFENTLELLIPDRDKDGKYIDPKSVIHFLTDRAANLFGGLNKRTDDGYWKSNTNEIISERVSVLEICFNSEQLAEFSMVVSTFIILLSRVLNQESAGYKVNGKLILVPTDTIDTNQNFELNGTKNEH